MNGLFRQLRSIVDVDDDADAAHGLTEAELDNLPNDVGELKERLAAALDRVKTVSEQWNELCTESRAIESELAALRLRHDTSREQWLLVHQFDQSTIDALLEERLAARAGGPHEPDAVFISSLRAQNETMRALIQKYGEERDRARLEAGPGAEPGTGAGAGPGPGVEPLGPSGESAAGVAALEAALGRQAQALAAMARERRHEAALPHHDAPAAENSLSAEQAQSAENSQSVENSQSTENAQSARLAELEREVEALRRAAEQPQPTADDAGETREESAAREEALHALYRDVQMMRAHNAELDAQLAGAGENAAQLAREAAAAREECLAERRRADEWRDAAERAHQERRRAGRELAAAGDELRRTRWLAEMRTASTEKSQEQLTQHHQHQQQALEQEQKSGFSAAFAPQSLSVKARSSLSDWRRILSTRSRTVFAIAAVVALLTLIFSFASGGAMEQELVALHLQEDLRLCRLQLQGNAASNAQRVQERRI